MTGAAPENGRAALLEQALALTRGRGRLLFLTFFGSTLYGTRRPDSDVDARGVYLPSETPADLAAAAAQRTLPPPSGPAGRRNAAGDADVELAPLERRRGVDLARGSVPDMDLLFAPASAACTIFRHPAMDAIFSRPLDFLGLADGATLRRYCLGQGKSVGLEGTRLGAIWGVWRALEDMPARERRGPRAAARAASGAAADHCAAAADGGLRLAGKEHGAGVRLAELRRRLERQLEGHLGRIEQARENRGVNWKNLAHALRACAEQQMLLREGTLRFPLENAGWFLDTRGGRVPFADVERAIVEALDATERLRAVSPFARDPDPEAVRRAAHGLRRAVEA